MNGNSVRLTGARLVANALWHYGVRFMFGNPGSTELPLLAELGAEGEEIRFVLCLHEDVAMAMAIGHAEATGEPVAVQVHTAAGLMHALTNLEAAKSLKLPILVIAGQQDSRMMACDPPLGGDIVGTAKHLVKWAWEPSRSEELPKVLHRAASTAMAPPRGPVVVSIPVNLLSGSCGPAILPLSKVRPPEPCTRDIDEAARLLNSSQKPIIIAGDGISAGGAISDIVRLAERLQAPVVTDRMAARANFPGNHSLFRGLIGRSGLDMQHRVAASDLALAVGCDSLVPLLYDGGLDVWPSELIVLAADPTDIVKGPPANLTILGNLDVSLSLLCEQLNVRVSAPPPRAADSPTGEDALTSASVARVLNDVLTRDSLLVEEAVSGKYPLFQEYKCDPPAKLLAAKTGGLGVGIGAAIGAALAERNQVVAVVGDGSYLYYPQAIWTAVHENARLVVIILNNRSYAVLYKNLELFAMPQVDMGTYFDLDRPPVDFTALSRAFGAEATTVSTVDDLRAALESARKLGGVQVIEACLSADGA